MTNSHAEFLTKTAADIVVAFLSQGSVPASELPGLVRAVRLALHEPIEQRPLVEPEQRGEVVQMGRPHPPEGSQESSGEGATAVLRSVPSAPQTPAVPIGESVHRDYLVSLEDGKHYRSLKRHLMSKYGMTPDDYRRKWNLPKDYPMVAPSYAQERSEVAKRIGLGSPANQRQGRRGARK